MTSNLSTHILESAFRVGAGRHKTGPRSEVRAEGPPEEYEYRDYMTSSTKQRSKPPTAAKVTPNVLCKHEALALVAKPQRPLPNLAYALNKSTVFLCKSLQAQRTSVHAKHSGNSTRYYNLTSQSFTIIILTLINDSSLKAVRAPMQNTAEIARVTIL